jgi:hypothetical protein
VQALDDSLLAEIAAESTENSDFAPKFSFDNALMPENL